MSDHGDTVWVVRDPSPDSTLGDILFSTNARDFAAYAIGTRLERFHAENTVFYTSPEQAREDALGRMSRRAQAVAQEEAKKRLAELAENWARVQELLAKEE